MNVLEGAVALAEGEDVRDADGHVVAAARGRRGRPPSSGSSPTTGPATATTTPSRRSSRASAATIPTRALYWLAAMIAAGEDPRFIARRLIISASEDVGNADPRALQVAVAAAQALDHVGLPEAQYALAQATTYIATAPEVEPVGPRLLARRWPTSRRAARCRCRSTSGRAGDRRMKAHGIGVGYRYPARLRGRRRRPAVPARRARRPPLLPADRPGLRGDDRRPHGRPGRGASGKPRKKQRADPPRSGCPTRCERAREPQEARRDPEARRRRVVRAA